MSFHFLHEGTAILISIRFVDQFEQFFVSYRIAVQRALDFNPEKNPAIFLDN